MESTQVVLVVGPAGNGKSGIAKDAVGILGADHFAFSFRAEEFASPHFDETLQRNQIPANATMLGAVLAVKGGSCCSSRAWNGSSKRLRAMPSLIF